MLKNKIGYAYYNIMFTFYYYCCMLLFCFVGCARKRLKEEDCFHVWFSCCSDSSCVGGNQNTSRLFLISEKKVITSEA